jgi:hypothetical protein
MPSALQTLRQRKALWQNHAVSLVDDGIYFCRLGSEQTTTHQAFTCANLNAAEPYDVVVYGSGLGGIAAALTARATLESNITPVGSRLPRVLLIATDSKLGGLATVGGQNFYDIAHFPSTQQQVPSQMPQQGSHRLFYEAVKRQCYATGDMAAQLYQLLSGVSSKGLTVMGGIDAASLAHDIIPGSMSVTGRKIASIKVQKLKRHGLVYVFDSSAPTTEVRASVFIDASEDGKLTRMLNGVVKSAEFVVGRKSRSYPGGEGLRHSLCRFSALRSLTNTAHPSIIDCC